MGKGELMCWKISNFSSTTKKDKCRPFRRESLLLLQRRKEVVGWLVVLQEDRVSKRAFHCKNDEPFTHTHTHTN
jgi:hypothetical protein